MVSINTNNSIWYNNTCFEILLIIIIYCKIVNDHPTVILVYISLYLIEQDGDDSPVETIQQARPNHKRSAPNQATKTSNKHSSQ